MSDTPRLGMSCVARTLRADMRGMVVSSPPGAQGAAPVGARKLGLAQFHARPGGLAVAVHFLLQEAVLVRFGFQHIALADDARIREILGRPTARSRPECKQSAVHDVLATRLADQHDYLLMQRFERFLVARLGRGVCRACSE